MSNLQAEETPTPFRQMLKQIQKRCLAAKIPCKEEEGLLDEMQLRIDFSTGRSSRAVYLMVEDDVTAFSKFKFEDFSFVENYNAIVNYQTGYIEAAVQCPEQLPKAYKLLFDVKCDPTSEPPELTEFDAIVLKQGSIEVSLGPSGSEFVAFANAMFAERPPIALRIKGAKITTSSAALTLLEKVANSVFFEIHSLFDVTLMLHKHYSGPLRRRTKENVSKQLLFPRYQYDNQPMSLYWYAKVSNGMPLLEFLAFYQVVEFYYPRFSQQDAVRRLKTMLKDPKLDLNSETDLARVLRTIKPSTRGFGSEVEQLHATIRTCLDSADLRAFLNENEDRRTFYESAPDYKLVAKQPIPLKNTAADLLQETAQRLYKIRCRIVHTKDSMEEPDTEPLLPFSRAAEHLRFDIELMEFIANRVLITTSQPFNVDSPIS